MADTIKAFYPRVASLPEIVDLVTFSFPDRAAPILHAMKAGADLGGDLEEVEELITEFVLDQAVVEKSYKGLGVSDTSSSEVMSYLEANHPEAHHLMQTQAKELERLLGKDGAAVALGQAREPFDINVLSWKGIYLVTAEDFEDAWFDDESTAVSFAQSNYGDFIKNLEDSKKPDRVI